MKSKEEVKNKVCMYWNSAVVFASKVNVTLLILTKTVIFIFRG